MTPENYKKKYFGKAVNSKTYEEIMLDFSNDFLVALHFGKGNKIKGRFKDCLTIQRRKWSSIFRFFPWCNNFWRTFLQKTVLNKFRELFPGSDTQWIEKLIKIEPEQDYGANKGYYQYQQQRENYYSFQKTNFLDLTQDYKLLGLRTSATSDEVKRKFRILAFLNHPDKGGKHEDFIKITEAKDRILKSKK